MDKTDQIIQEITDGKIIRGIVSVLLAEVGLFVINLLPPVQLAFWLFAAIGLILGLLYSVLRFHQWLKYSREEANRWTTTNYLKIGSALPCDSLFLVSR